MRMPVTPLPNNPDVCKISLIFQRDTREFVNSFHIRRGGGWTVAQVTSAIVDAISWWNSNIRTSIPAAVALVRAEGRVYNPAAPIVVTTNVSPASVGGRGGTAEAANVSLTLSERTGLAGRA